jgi:hypothetical protein
MLPTHRRRAGAAPDRSAWKQVSTTAGDQIAPAQRNKSAEGRRDPRCHARAMRLDEQANATRALRLRAPQKHSAPDCWNANGASPATER